MKISIIFMVIMLALACFIPAACNEGKIEHGQGQVLSVTAEHADPLESAAMYSIRFEDYGTHEIIVLKYRGTPPVWAQLYCDIYWDQNSHYITKVIRN